MTSVNPFQHRKKKRRAAERAVFVLFGLATYLVLACAAEVFLDIAAKGSRTVFP